MASISAKTRRSTAAPIPASTIQLPTLLAAALEWAIEERRRRWLSRILVLMLLTAPLLMQYPIGGN